MRKSSVVESPPSPPAPLPTAHWSPAHAHTALIQRTRFFKKNYSTLLTYSQQQKLELN